MCIYRKGAWKRREVKAIFLREIKESGQKSCQIRGSYPVHGRSFRHIHLFRFPLNVNVPAAPQHPFVSERMVALVIPHLLYYAHLCILFYCRVHALLNWLLFPRLFLFFSIFCAFLFCLVARQVHLAFREARKRRFRDPCSQGILFPFFFFYLVSGSVQKYRDKISLFFSARAHVRASFCFLFFFLFLKSVARYFFHSRAFSILPSGPAFLSPP